MSGGRRVPDVFIELLETISVDNVPSLDVEAVNDVILVDKNVLASLVALAESLVPGDSGEVNMELVVNDAVGEALAGKSELALDVASGNVAGCESVLTVSPPWFSSSPSPGVGVDVVGVAVLDASHISVQIPGPSRPASFNGLTGGSSQGRFSAGVSEEPATLSRPASARLRSNTALLDSLKTSIPIAASQLHHHRESSFLCKGP